MTWFVRDQGYELFFNRDERNSRHRALLPAVTLLAGVQVVAPTDTDAGGTWIAANQFGVTVCLLNHYQFEQIESYKDWTSRGQIVRHFSSAAQVGDVATHFSTLPLSDYRAFRLFVIEPSGANCLCVWDGHAPRIEHNVSSPKSSSSVDASHVKGLRRALFRNLGLAELDSTRAYLAYHASHLPSRSKESVCMHREDASTVSLTHVAVTAEQVQVRYADGAPCKALLGEPVGIARQSLHYDPSIRAFS
ncbi:NRDE family protein [Arenicella chitinivorans]|nr:NRDE family protein [Arenicella chitinivorans]